MAMQPTTPSLHENEHANSAQAGQGARERHQPTTATLVPAACKSLQLMRSSCAAQQPVGGGRSSHTWFLFWQCVLHHRMRSQTPSEMVASLMETLYALHLIQSDAAFKPYFPVALRNGTEHGWTTLLP